MIQKRNIRFSGRGCKNGSATGYTVLVRAEVDRITGWAGAAGRSSTIVNSWVWPNHRPQGISWWVNILSVNSWEPFVTEAKTY